MLLYLPSDDVTAVYVDSVAPGPYGNAGGYGTHATRYRVRLADGRTRRVYVDVLGNSGVAYVRKAGRYAYIGTDVGAILEGAAGMTLERAREVASQWQSPGTVGLQLATLATTGEAPADLADDVRATLATVGEVSPDRYPLLRLLGWALSH